MSRNKGHHNILIVGIGALGSEILLQLLQQGYTQIHLIDMDTIATSNLHRQFFFRSPDIGAFKAEIAASRAGRVYPEADISFTARPMEQMSLSFFLSFDIVFSALDNVTARRWLNSTLHLLRSKRQQSVLLVDCGTEALMGHIFLIPIASETLSLAPVDRGGCIECHLDLFKTEGRDQNLPLCTLAGIPRRPEHCLGWAISVQWPQIYPNTVFDPSVEGHVIEVYEFARLQAEKCGIDGVTLGFVHSSLPRALPAVITTSSLIASYACMKMSEY